jgi:ATP-dependent Lon protease
MIMFGDQDDLHFSQGIDEDTDFIPLLSTIEEDSITNEKVPDVLPILPLRNTVLFPGVVIPITVGRDKSIQLIKDYNKGDKTIGVMIPKILMKMIYTE